MKLIIFMIIFLVQEIRDVSSFSECQVILNRAQLATWIPSYATEAHIYLSKRNIQSIEASTFLNLKSLNYLYLSNNQLNCLDPEFRRIKFK